MTTVFCNRRPIPHRSLNDAEQAKLDKDRANVRASPGLKLNTASQLHLMLLESPQGGDDITYSDLPDEYDELWVRWPNSSGDGHFNMRIDP